MSLLRNKVNCLLNEIKRGNVEKPLKKLFDITYTPLIIVATQYLCDDLCVDDAIIEGYMSIVDSIADFDDEKDGFNWICKIVENKAKNIAKKENKQINVRLFCENDFQRDFTDQIEQKNDVFSMLKKLPTDERILIVKRFFDFLTLREISVDTGIPVSTLDKKIKKILKKLREIEKNTI